MPTFSRWMPPVTDAKWSALATVLVGGLALVGLWLISVHPWLLAGLAGLAAIAYLLDRPWRVRMGRWAAERHGDNICTFARAVPRPERDAWIIRALYEELAPYARIGGAQVPIRPSDRLREDLAIDEEDLAYAVAAVAKRVGRTMEGCEANEYHSRVSTVADLIAFLRRQPLSTE